MGTIEKHTLFTDLTLVYLFQKFTKYTFVENKKKNQQTLISD